MSRYRVLALAWLALMALLALTWASAFAHLGGWNSLLNTVISVAKAAIVLTLFMHLLRARSAQRLALAVALAMQAVLWALTTIDDRSRVIHVAPGDKPASATSEAFDPGVRYLK